MDYLEKVDGTYQKAMKEEEVFTLPSEKRIALMGPDLFSVGKEILLKNDAVIIKYAEANS
jgi:hypothetical protein